MGWDISLLDKQGQAVEVGRHQEGSTYAIGGTDVADIAVTYNYGRHFRDALEDPDPTASNVLGRLLGERRAGDAIPMLERAVAKLGTMRSEDYWASEPGNAGYALSILLGWARLHPDAVFHVT